jgi:membrane protein DedA with SNARE-associated domain
MGYLGIFIGLAIESSFFPIPSEITLIPAGVLIANGQMNFFLVFLAAVFGSLLGASLNYFIAFFLGRKTVDYLISKYGKFLFLTSEKLKKTDMFFEKHGEITTFVGRLIFVARHLISLPAGFSRMNFFKFSLFTFLGSALWILILLLVGIFFGTDTIEPITKIVATSLVMVSIVTVVIYYMLRSKKNKKKN